jgi:hypothetical protein
MKKVLIITGAIFLTVGIAAASFWGGMAYQTNRAEQTQARFMQARGFTDPGQFPPDADQFPNGGLGFIRGGGTTGLVKTIEGNVLTISTAQDVTTVNLSAATKIEKSVSGAIGDLQSGMRVMITGQRDNDGNITASLITILSDNLPRVPADTPPPAGTEP